MTKKVFVVGLLAITAFTAKAQTISTLNPQAGMQHAFSYADLTIADSGSVGMNQTWDFSNASLLGSTTTRTYRNLTAQEQQAYPNATLAYTIDQEPEVYFMAAGADSLAELGDEGFPLANPAILYVYPITAENYSFTDNVSASMPGVLDLNGTATMFAQGSGILITPFGTFANVIKLKRVAQSQLSFMGQLINATITTFIWVNADNQTELLSIDFTDYEDETEVDELSALFLTNGSALSVGEIQDISWSIAPNPVQSELRIAGEIPTGSSYVIYATTGQAIDRGGIPVNGTIDVSHLEPGNYLFTLLDGANRTSTIRFAK